MKNPIKIEDDSDSTLPGNTVLSSDNPLIHHPQVTNEFLKGAKEVPFVENPGQKLTLAGDARVGFFDTKVEAGYEYGLKRSSAEVIYFRTHELSDENVRDLLVPDRYKELSAEIALLERRYKELQSSFQNLILGWYLQKVRATVTKMGGMQLWSQTDRKQRMQFWAHLYDGSPAKMGIASLQSLAQSIPVAMIYTSEGPVNKKWQRYLKQTFCFTAETTYCYRVAAKQDQKMFSFWQSMPNHKKFVEMDLGGIEAIPIRKMGQLDQGRRDRAYVEADSDLELPVSSLHFHVCRH